MSNRQLQRAKAKQELKNLKKKKQLPKNITLSQYTQSQKLTGEMIKRFNNLKHLEETRVKPALDADANKQIEDMFLANASEDDYELIDVTVD